ncbi:MAG: hypothetical protein WCK67_07945 [bacterium]
MSYDFIYEKEDKKIKLNDDYQEELVQSITSSFTTWQTARNELIVNSDKLIAEIFFKNKPQQKNNTEEQWKAKVKMCKLFMLYQTLKAFIWKNVYANTSSMFDVAGENQDSDNNSNKQKAMLVNIFEEMKLQKRIDEIIDNGLLYGEMIAFVGWKQEKKQIRRPISFFEAMFKDDVSKLPKILKALQSGKKFYIDYITKYDNPYVYSVNPVNFVFDVTQMEDWDSCPKILKRFRTPDDIINNKIYKVSKECKEFLKEKLTSSTSLSENKNQNASKLKDEVVNGNTIEVLEHWGNIKLKDGTVLNNWHVVVVGRKYVVRFQENQFVENPFVFGTFILDPDLKRGITPIMSVYELALMQEDLMSKTLDMQTLNANPPIYAPKDFFTQEEIKLYPGKVITFDPNLYKDVPITPMKFESDIFINDILSLDRIISEVSGIFPNMTGQDEKRDATATEISVKVQGQTTRLFMLLDVVNQDLTIPIVEKTADLKANFTTGKETIYNNKDDKREFIEIDDSVRQGKYQYKYSDRSSFLERVSNADNMALAFEKFANVLPLNWQKIFTWFWEQKGVENPERFLASMPQPQLSPPTGNLEIPQQNIAPPAPVNDAGILPQTPEQGM